MILNLESQGSTEKHGGEVGSTRSKQASSVLGSKWSWEEPGTPVRKEGWNSAAKRQVV